MNTTKTIARQTFKNAQRHFIVWGGLVCIVFFLSMAQPAKTFDKPVTDGSYGDVLSKHECNDTVTGQFPTGAIVREVGAGYSFTTNQKMIGKGLDEQFAGKNWKRFDVIHFCK